MDKQGRYSTSGMIEDQYIAGSHGQVLKNLLNITTNREIDRVETELLFVLTDQLMDEFDRDRVHPVESNGHCPVPRGNENGVAVEVHGHRRNAR